MQKIVFDEWQWVKTGNPAETLPGKTRHNGISLSLIELREQLPSAGRVWLRHQFTMPENDECALWWLECDKVVSIWVNGQEVVTHGSQDITMHVAMGKNELILAIDDPDQLPHEVALNPYPCD